MAIEVPNGWKQVRLGDVATVGFSGVDKKTVRDEVPVRLCNYTDVYYNRRILPDAAFMSATATHAEICKWGLKKDDVLFTKDSETAGDIGVPAYVTETMPDVLCGYHLGRARPNPDLLEGRFLSHLLLSQEVSSELSRIANGITRFGLTLPNVRSLPLTLPTPAEQRGIAAVLDSIDEAIERTEALIAATENLRESLRHELLTRGMPGWHTEWKEVPRLGTIPATWRVSTLTQVLILNQPGAWGKQPSKNPGVPVLRATNLTRDGQINPTQVAKRRLSEKDISRRLMEDGDIMLERSGGGPGTPVGRVALIRGLGPVYCNNFCQQLRVDRSKVMPYWAAQALWHRYLQGVTSRLEHRTTGIRNLDYGGYLSFPFPIPPLAEQGAISKALEGLYEGIEVQEQVLRNLNNLKASASQALLTGRVRVPVVAGSADD